MRIKEESTESTEKRQKEKGGCGESEEGLESVGVLVLGVGLVLEGV